MAVLSIRRKIAIAAAALYVFIAANMLASYFFMQKLEEKIGYLEDVSKLEESVLEIRRFEKNFFLYGDSLSLQTAVYHIARANRILTRDFPKIESLSSPETAKAFQRNLHSYEEVLSEYSKSVGEGRSPQESETRAQQEAEIRKLGTSISDFVETVARNKRDSIKETMEQTVRLEFLAFGLIAVGFTLHASFLFSKVLTALRRLEKSTEDIAQGRFERIRSLPPEKEFRDIFLSFNRMAEQLRIREEQLVQSKKLASLGTMLAGVAHEVNNPLSNISSSCEILLEEIDDGDKEFQKTLLAKVVEQVDKARSIVLNLLEFSRNREFCKEQLNLKEVLESSLRLLCGQIPCSVQVAIEVPENLTIFADKQRIQQALINLMSNSIQAVSEEGDVKILARDDGSGMVQMSVHDTGVGIKHEDLPRIFDPFFTTKDVGQGTGLGLFITHDIIVRHGGSIEVESTPGKGTTFLVRLPSKELAG